MNSLSSMLSLWLRCSAVFVVSRHHRLSKSKEVDSLDLYDVGSEQASDYFEGLSVPLDPILVFPVLFPM